MGSKTTDDKKNNSHIAWMQFLSLINDFIGVNYDLMLEKIKMG